MNRVTCPHCGKSLKTTPAFAGKVVACPQCKGHIQLPANEPPPIPEFSIEFIDETIRSPEPAISATAQRLVASQPSVPSNPISLSELFAGFSIGEVLVVTVLLTFALIFFLDSCTAEGPRADRVGPAVFGVALTALSAGFVVLFVWLQRVRIRGRRRLAEDRQCWEQAERAAMKRALANEPRTLICADVRKQLIAFDAHLKATFSTTIFPAEHYVGLLAKLSVSLAEFDAEAACPMFAALARRVDNHYSEICRLFQTFPRQGQAIIGGGFGITGMVEGMAIASVANWAVNSSVRGKQRAASAAIAENVKEAHNLLHVLVEAG